MRLLLDECVDRGLARRLVGHSIQTVQQMGWSGLKNGRLLSRAQHRFDVLVTVDRGLTYQQSVADHKIAVLVLIAPSSRLRDLEPLVPDILAALPTLQSGMVRVLGNLTPDQDEVTGEPEPPPADSPDEPKP